MATSESDDFESADEELSTVPAKRPSRRQWTSPTTIDSESDPDTEDVPPNFETLGRPVKRMHENPLVKDKPDTPDKAVSKPTDNVPAKEIDSITMKSDEEPKRNMEESKGEDTSASLPKDNTPDGTVPVEEKKLEVREKRVKPPRKSEGAKNLGTKKLGTKIISDTKPAVEENVLEDLSKKFEELRTSEEQEGEKIIEEPPEIFEHQGWEGLGNDVELSDELTEEKLQPVLDRLSSAGQELDNSSGWGGWSNWGMSTLFDTATAGVSTLTSHVTHGLTLLEESIGMPDSDDEKKEQEESTILDEKSSEPQETQPIQSFGSFGFGNLMSGVSSITKLVESTSSKVMSGGLDTLEAIGKKTMEVLQEGDPGLKKKRAFFIPEPNKPNLSQVLREAKEKAETAEKSKEEKHYARKVHFESLFDDYQGLVHLEALEMLSKQSKMKIQQYLMNLSGSDLTSVQETLEDVKELCDLTSEEEEDENSIQKELKVRLQNACSDLGIDINYDKLCNIWEDSQRYVDLPVEKSDQDIFQTAISVLAQFTASCIERFHKTAELLLIKPRRSTVNEADALVQLTRILSTQVGLLANTFCDSLNELAKTSEKWDNVNANITTVFVEATNASSYVEDAFRLLIPIVQVGAI